MYVFGLDLPLAEAMTISFLVLFLAIWLIYYELRKLSKLFDEEKSDITKLDSDIHLIDQIIACGKPHETLSTYVAQKMSNGHSIDTVKENLSSAGFQKDVINKAVQAGKIQATQIQSIAASTQKISNTMNLVEKAKSNMLASSSQEVKNQQSISKKPLTGSSINELEYWLQNRK